MKKIVLFIILIFTIQLSAQDRKEIKVKTKVNKATVFLKGAQITRYKTVQLPAGKNLLKFTGLSPFVNDKTIQIKASGNVMILGVNYQHNHLNKNKLPKVLVNLKQKYDELQDKIDLENANLEVINSEISFLNENRKIGGKSQNLTVSALKSVGDYYTAKLRNLKLKQIAVQKKLKKLREEQQKIDREYQKNSNKKVYPSGEIWVKLDAKTNSSVKFTLTYNVDNAGWFPSYDIRVNQLNKPLNIVYKANVKQDTKVDWKNVKLSFSSTNPEIPGDSPKLNPYRLSYYSSPPVYSNKTNAVYGTVTEAGTGDPLPGVNVLIKGTSIGTATDFDGHYTLTLPNNLNNNVLEFSMIGYKTATRYVSPGVLDVILEPSADKLGYVVVTALGAPSQKRMKKKNKKQSIDKDKGSISIPLQRIEKQTSISFTIKKPYTILSNNMVAVVPMQDLKVPAQYKYIAVPRVTPNAYLLSDITDWEKYGLLSGQANVFIEGTFTGKSLLDTAIANDTLQIALGVDKGISIKREKGKDFTGKKLIGTKRTDKREWLITVKNNKKQAVDIDVLDQVPVSVTDEIKVEVTEKSKGKLDEDTGIITWNLHLKPGQKKVLKLRYQVKYSRYRNLNLE